MKKLSETVKGIRQELEEASMIPAAGFRDADDRVFGVAILRSVAWAWENQLVRRSDFFPQSEAQKLGMSFAIRAGSIVRQGVSVDIPAVVGVSLTAQGLVLEVFEAETGKELQMRVLVPLDTLMTEKPEDIIQRMRVLAKAAAKKYGVKA
jgi:hypothetical protein